MSERTYEPIYGDLQAPSAQKMLKDIADRTPKRYESDLSAGLAAAQEARAEADRKTREAEDNTRVLGKGGDIHPTESYIDYLKRMQGNIKSLMQEQTVPKLVLPTQAHNPNAMVGIGGGPTRATTLPTTGAERKQYPIATGFFDYFPDAIAAVAHLSWVANEQHNPGEPVHWARGKSTDHDDTLLRHFAQRGTIDTDKVRHRTKVAWRALAALQEEIEEAQRQQNGEAA